MHGHREFTSLVLQLAVRALGLSVAGAAVLMILASAL
jgi:hypothetical protein